jgi:peptidoglycan/xylan/chitin deacetylase (PgdA/CDA1 family)
MHVKSIEIKQKFKRLLGNTAKLAAAGQPRLIILNYHSIHPTNVYSTTPQDFSEQMEQLKSKFNIISLSEFYEIKQRDIKVSDNLAVVTFDDGYEDNYLYAFPILHKFEIKATIFLATGFITGETDITRKHVAYRGLRPLTWDQILSMRQSCISFGSHTHTHPVLTNISPDRAKAEITISKNILEDKLSEAVRTFAYPYGQHQTFNRSIANLLGQAGFETACSALWGNNNKNTDIFALRRIRIDAVDTIEDFKSKINGHWDFIRFFQMIQC